MVDKITFKIKRYNPKKDKKGYFEEFVSEVREGWTILDYLNHIKWTKDGSLTFRRSCRSAVCGSCAMNINKKNSLACHTQISELNTNIITLEPLPSFPVIKDLVVDMTEFYEKIESIMPWLVVTKPLGDKENLQLQEERDKVGDASTCIMCGSCTSSCPSYWTNKDYLGPAALYKTYRFAFDSRDDAFSERINLVDDKNGLFRCHTIFNCVQGCPKNLNPTHGISELKKACVEKLL